MKLMARRNSMITSIGKSRWNMSVCITVLKNSIVFLFFFFLLVLVSSCRRSSTINTPNGEYKMIDCQEINGGKFKLSSIASTELKDVQTVKILICYLLYQQISFIQSLRYQHLIAHKKSSLRILSLPTILKEDILFVIEAVVQKIYAARL